MKTLSKIQKYVSILTLIFLAIFLVSYFAKNKLPDPKSALSLLKNDPIQTPTDAKKFTIKSGDSEYEITPLYNYELYGMIVSTGDNLGWLSRFKDRDPLNSNDLCVIWGSNVDSGIYQQMSFKNEEFVCKIEYNGDYKDYSKYSNNHLSNNHLLADGKTNSEIYSAIRTAKAGDQIYFKGYLASYTTKKAGVLLGSRGSSTTREDSGMGACETVYIKSFEIIKKYNSPIFVVNQLSKEFSIFGIILWTLLFFAFLIIPNKYQRSDETILSSKITFKESLPVNITKEKSIGPESDKKP